MTKTAPPLGPEALELVAARFRVLGEPSRLRLLQLLRAGELNVSSLVERSGLTQANASRHLQTLAEAGMVGRRRSGQSVVYFIADASIFDLCAHVCGSVRRRLDAHARAMKGR
ncbi:MAG: helix-turn-helix transcriptional regulator [Verrucomicrobia bacterium]|nr:MAG: helix-turn-helix transcriptional regulator [Verrucomicrobiota bacterium]